MLEPDGSPNTAHTINPVPVIVTVPDLSLRDGGVLADVAPTVLALLGIEQPAEMTGRSLISDYLTAPRAGRRYGPPPLDALLVSWRSQFLCDGDLPRHPARNVEHVLITGTVP